MNHIRACAKMQHKKGFLSDSQLEELHTQLSCTNCNESIIANYHFMEKRHAMTVTETANEVRHHNCECGEDRVEPNINMAESSHKMNEKRKNGVNKN